MKSVSARIYSKAFYRKNEEIELVVELINNTARTVLLSKNIAAAFNASRKESITKASSKQKDPTSRSGLYKLNPHSNTLKKVKLNKRFADNNAKQEITLRLSVLNPHFEKAKNGSAKKIPTKSIKTKLVIGKPGNGLQKKVHDAGSILKSASTGVTHRLAVEELPPFVEAAIACEVIGGTQHQQVAMKRAHDAGYALAYNALQRLRNDNEYQKWFGIYDDHRFRIVRSALLAIVEGFQNRTFTYDLRNSSSADEIGSAEYRNNTINFYNKFWELEDEGPGSRAGRVLHEHTHVSANTLDSAYNRGACLNKARTFPNQAIENANNYQFFAEG